MKKDTTGNAPSNEAIAEARKKIRARIRWKASKALSEADQEDVAQDAIVRWCQAYAAGKDAVANKHADWALGDFWEERGREVKLRDDPDAVETQNTGAWSRSGVGEGVPREGVRTYGEGEQSELWEAVREAAAKRYQQTWGKPWSESARRNAIGDELDAQLVASEEAAQRELRALQSALASARRWLNDDLVTDGEAVTIIGHASATLIDLEPEIRALHAAVHPKGDGHMHMGTVTKRDLRVRLLVERALTHTEYPSWLGCDRQPNVIELADIWLLAGGRPVPREWGNGITVAQVIETARATVKKADKAVRDAHGDWVDRVAAIIERRSKE